MTTAQRTEMARRRPSTPRRGTSPDPYRLAGLLVQVWFEVCSGRRPFAQLRPLVAPALRRQLFAQLPRGPVKEAGPAVRIRRVIGCEPRPDVYEASVLVERQNRTTALAVRLERHRGAWRVVELTAPEAGLRPLVTASSPAHAPRPPDAFDEVLGDRV